MEIHNELIPIQIDNKTIKVPKGKSILEIAQMEGIKIPTLCHHDDLATSGICRICVVEVEGMRTLQAACSYPVYSSMTIHTHSPKVRQARKDIIELMLSNHYGQCYSCVRNQNCELQDLANEYGIDMLRFGHLEESLHKVDDSSVSVIRDMDKCILCRRCVNTCEGLQGVGVYEAIGRGSHTEIKTFLDTKMADAICINCGQCINHCPTGALHANDPRSKIWEAIEDPSKHVVIQTAPAPRSAIGECFGLEPGTALTKEMNTGIKLCGFDKVFDTNFSADLTIIEEGTELLKRLYKAIVKKEETALPLFTSCSPGWVKFIEHFYPEMLGHLSTCKSPQQMFGAIIKTYYSQLYNIPSKDIVTIALMPCTAKKFELSRPEMNSSGHQDMDYGLTTRELAQMLKESGIDLPSMEKSDFDDPFGTATGSGVIFGATGGVMESAIRTVYELVTGEPIEKVFNKANILPLRGFEGIRYAELTIDKIAPVPAILSHIFQDWEWLKGVTLKVAVTHGTANAGKVLEDIKNKGELSGFHFIEYMACTGGCLGGGGMPIPTSEEIRKKRAEVIYKEDEASQVRKSYENPAVIKLYKEFLTDGPGGSISHKFLHTTYTKRGISLPTNIE
ncbi:MAG: [FeFe] hydrogenase, group A [Leptospiraceae bacterium]|nr:[FeFe] hydrogenase, group A [Leptospiraceae bacterium]